MKIIQSLVILAFVSVPVFAVQSGTWGSASLQRSISYRVVQQPGANENVTVIRLAKIMMAGNPALHSSKDSLVRSSCRTIELDYEHDPKAAFPAIALDIAKLRDDIYRHGLFKDLGLDPARIFILPEGYALKTDVLYYADEARPLYMDIAYPTGLDKPVPCLLEFSCDNTNRMGNFSLAVCRDTLLESFATVGYAFAMADHPVPPPYKGIDPMPDCGYKVKAAVRTLKAMGKELPISGKIGCIGFSRGSGMALLLATTQGMDRFEGKGENPGEDSSIQAAVALSGRFTYLNLLPDDHMWPRYLKAWGNPEENPLVWREQGALDYLESATIPLFLSINSGEGPDAQLQMTVLRQRLAELGNDSAFTMDRDGLGHKVPINPSILDQIRGYLDRQLR